MSLNKILSFLIFFSCSSYISQTTPPSIFKIFPYTVMSEGNEVYLKFEVNASVPLIINDRPVHAQKNQLTEIPIGSLICSKILKLEIKDQTSGKSIFHSELPSLPCDDSTPLSLGFLSDTHNSYTNQNELYRVLSKDWEYGHTNLLLHGGDVVHKGGKLSEWEEFFEASSPAFSPRPLVAAIGNHEYQARDSVSWPFVQFLRGKSWPWSGFILSFPQCNILIFNSNFNRISERQQQEQWAFVETELKKSYETAKPTIFLLHHAVFTSNIFKRRKFETRYLQERLVPLVEKYKVALVLSGDVHLYERSEKNGVNYLTAGAFAWYKMLDLGGNPYQKFSKSLSTTYTWLEVTRQKIHLKTFLTDKSLLDEYVIDLTKH